MQQSIEGMREKGVKLMKISFIDNKGGERNTGFAMLKLRRWI